MDTSVQVAVPHYGIYDMAEATGLRYARAVCGTGSSARGCFRKRYADDPTPFEAASPILRITPDAPDFFVAPRHPRQPGRRGPGPTVRREAARRVQAHVVYAELPGAQHAFDVFPSIRSAHIVRAVDRYLHWHWNQYRREQLTI